MMDQLKTIKNERKQNVNKNFPKVKKKSFMNCCNQLGK